MIKGILHKGSGLGNQLHRLVGTKVLALKKGEEHTMIAQDLFKGKDFIKLDIKPDNTKYTIEHGSGRVIPESYDGVVDGEFQAEGDFIEYLDEIQGWIKTEPLNIPDDVCIINFRGGEYVGVKDLFLPQEYWDKAIRHMMGIKPEMKFEVHTDDPETARQFFDYPITKDIGLNWRSIRYAKYLILSNSSFAILPAHLNQNVEKIIAPLWWAGYNKGYWQMENNNYKKFTYI